FSVAVAVAVAPGCLVAVAVAGLLLVGSASSMACISRSHPSRIFLLFTVFTFTPCFFANAGNEILLVSQSSRIFSQLGIILHPLGSCLLPPSPPNACHNICTPLVISLHKKSHRLLGSLFFAIKFT